MNDTYPAKSGKSLALTLVLGLAFLVLTSTLWEEIPEEPYLPFDLLNISQPSSQSLGFGATEDGNRCRD